jgi:hypothetical protein
MLTGSDAAKIGDLIDVCLALVWRMLGRPAGWISNMGV